MLVQLPKSSMRSWSEPARKLREEVSCRTSYSSFWKPVRLRSSLGSAAVAAAGDFYQESLDAMKQLQVRAGLLVGASPDNHPQGPIPGDVGVFEYAPFPQLFPRSAVIVH